MSKKLSQPSLALIESWSWKCEVAETLTIVPTTVDEIPDNMSAWIISSRNSWHAVARFIERAPAELYCIGNWVREQATDLPGNSVIKTFENMKSLAADLKEKNYGDALYFCGEQHRGELEEVLQGSRTTIHKVITHQSILNYPVVQGEYDAVFVFSPRSVESLLLNNTFPDQTVFACIGETTLSYVKSRGIASTFCASYPDSELLLKEFYQHALKS